MHQRAALLVILLVGAGHAQLSGLYTIDPTLPAGGGNYISLNAASADLGAQGVAGPVVFEIYGTSATPYTETANWIPGISLGSNSAVWVLASWPGTSNVNTVTFRAGPGQSPVLDASGKDCVIYWNGADYTTIEGLELFGAAYDAVCMYTPSVTPTGAIAGAHTALNNTITRCHIHDCGAVGVLFYANSGQLNDTTISNNFFHTLVTSSNRGGFGNFVRDGYCAGRRDSGTRIINNTFLVDTLSTSPNTSLGVIIERHGGSATHTGIVQIQGNVVYKTTPNGPIYKFYSSTAAPTPGIWDNNCLYDISGGPFGDLFGTVYMDFLTWQAGTGLEPASFPLDPQLVSTTAPLDLHIQASSPCVDAMPMLASIPVDYDGDPRGGAMVDVGADEQGGGCTTPLYEENDAACEFLIDGVVGAQCAPAVTTISIGASGVAAINSTNIGSGFEMVFTFSPLIPIGSGAVYTLNGQILNVPLNTGFLAFLNGGTAPSFNTPFPGNLSLPFTAPGSPFTACAQVVILDGSHPDGFALSQGAQLIVQ